MELDSRFLEKHRKYADTSWALGEGKIIWVR